MHLLNGKLISAAMLDIEWRSAGGRRATPGYGHLDEVKYKVLRHDILCGEVPKWS